jgi:hypothetical protein
MTMSKSNDISSIATFDDHRPLADSELAAVTGGIARSMPNGRTDVIKAMGNLKWSDVELSSGN